MSPSGRSPAAAVRRDDVDRVPPRERNHASVRLRRPVPLRPAAPRRRDLLEAAGIHSALVHPNRVTGIGGIFFKANDPEALQAWYKRHLGIDVQAWGGAAFSWADGAARR